MTKSTILLPAAGFVIAVGCALAPRTQQPVPFFGYDPDTKVCTQGTIEGSCGNGTAVRCTVSFNGYTGIPAFDNKSGSTCSVAVYRASGESDPDTLILN